VVFHRAKAAIKDSKAWECLREGALTKDIRKNRKQGTGVEAGVGVLGKPEKKNSVDFNRISYSLVD